MCHNFTKTLLLSVNFRPGKGEVQNIHLHKILKFGNGCDSADIVPTYSNPRYLTVLQPGRGVHERW